MSAALSSALSTIQGYVNGTTPIGNLVTAACDMKVINPVSFFSNGYTAMKTAEAATEKSTARIPSAIHFLSSAILTISTLDAAIGTVSGTYGTQRLVLDTLLIPIGLTQTLFALHKGAKMRAATYLCGVVVPSAISLWNNVTAAKMDVTLANGHQVSLIYPTR